MEQRKGRSFIYWAKDKGQDMYHKWNLVQADLMLETLFDRWKVNYKTDTNRLRGRWVFPKVMYQTENSVEDLHNTVLQMSALIGYARATHLGMNVTLYCLEQPIQTLRKVYKRRSCRKQALMHKIK